MNPQPRTWMFGSIHDLGIPPLPPLTHGEILSGGREAHIYHVLSFQKAVKSRARVLELMYLCRGIIIVSFFQMMIYL